MVRLGSSSSSVNSSNGIGSSSSSSSSSSSNSSNSYCSSSFRLSPLPCPANNITFYLYFLLINLFGLITKLKAYRKEMIKEMKKNSYTNK